MLSRRFSRRRAGAFTLMEVMTCIIVVAILLVMLIPVFTQVIRRMQRTTCISNLKSLHVAADSYLLDHRMWPQIGTGGVDPQAVATNWINTFQPYGLTQRNWICPTRQKLLLNPDLTDPENVRIDYTATPFDRNPMTPMRWSTQPWFVESGDVHGNGQLMIFPDGHVQEVGDFLYLLKKSTPASH